MKNLNKTYDPKEFEERIYRMWEEEGDFIADAGSGKEPYTIVMPPPNVTGNLHLGHAMNNTLQDILIRWKRMSGYEALWVPGTDHASISTEAKVVDRLRKRGISKKEIGRDAFLEEAWAWTEEYGDNIKHQLRKLGVSCDWSRDRFTLDAGLSKAVNHVFKTMYEEHLIYRGDRIVNWCPSCGTAISDAEVEHQDETGHLWHIRYPRKDGKGFIQIATTRPETMLGDLAVAVNPEDGRYADLIGKTVILPLVGREIPVIADEYVETEFGTGCVKITPSHDPNDFEVGQRHGLGQCVVIGEEGQILEGYAPYSGLDRYEARKRIVADLAEQGLLDHVEELPHAVGHCERCGTVIEPLLSKQWFVSMDALARPAKKAVEEGAVRLIPQRFDKIYHNWLDNIRDWCISRQLWWGHRIPVWYCADCGEMTVAEEPPTHCAHCGGTHLTQDADTLDTWFSSALWPFATLGWPEKTPDMEKFFPTNTLVTGYDILFFWVIRMIFSSLHQTGKAPFENVYFTGLIRDDQGRKMSKSLGNGIDPLEVINQYGADALRFTLISGNSPGNDMRYYDERVRANRNFANKLWNATRFVLMNLEDGVDYSLDRAALDVEDRWILSRLNEVRETLDRNLSKFEIGLGAAALYDFVWFQFCDWYVEFVKPRLYGDDEVKKHAAASTLLYVLSNIVRLLHPFMPFITEEIWSTLPGTEGKIIHAPYPMPCGDDCYPEEEKAIELAIAAITAIRNERAQRDIAPSKKSPITLYSAEEEVRRLLAAIGYEFEHLAGASRVAVVDVDPTPDNAACLVLDRIKIYLSLEGLVDYEAEKAKLEKDLQHCRGEIERAQKLLDNAGFVQRAPEAVVQKEREKLQAAQKLSAELEQAIGELVGRMK
ncbi:MAG: valine--tRNA ligase [Ndongobacter sp.]|nr:valine--tRNA ligase [Ndongobacter sp.]